ncbi:Probable secreted protein [Raoultella terrigena]|uniref:Probable secreted protein n=1 Tax=Raoultella terrigena TaxID=577 RepID=A0A7Z8ZF81_RAOTE|nr:Probable secreted protein [Raoultella terrigena]
MKKQLRMALLALAVSPLMALAQQQFSTPELAANALAEALGQNNDSALTALLGDSWQQFLPPEGIDPDAVARFQRDWKISHRIVQQADTAWLDVGSEAWRLPVPMVKSSEGWHFDMAAGEDEILTRAIGRNELAAIQAMHAYVDAQQDFYQLNHTWAKKIISSPGKKDGLYWPTAPGEAPSPLGPAFSPVEPGAGYHGYHFRMIHDEASQGEALLAWPVTWGETGVMSFMIDRRDRVYQANLGENTADQAWGIVKFAPDSRWQALEHQQERPAP